MCNYNVKKKKKRSYLIQRKKEREKKKARMYYAIITIIIIDTRTSLISDKVSSLLAKKRIKKSLFSLSLSLLYVFSILIIFEYKRHECAGNLKKKTKRKGAP
jgi:hypothetical protein